MKSRLRKMTLLTGILFAMSCTVCACGGEKEVSVQGEQRMDDGDTDPKNTASSAGTSTVTDKRDAVQNPAAKGGDTGDQTDGVREEPQNGDCVSGVWSDSAPDLEGSIKEMQDGRFTVVEAITDKTDDGAGDIIIEPAPGSDDSDYNKVTVIYDEKTLFAVQTIYDGGARSEMEESTAAALENGRSVKVWGDIEDGELKAAQICIIKVL